LINRFFHHDGGEAFAANFDFNFVSGFGKFRRHIAHADADVPSDGLCVPLTTSPTLAPFAQIG
jgi:hypothetical protein